MLHRIFVAALATTALLLAAPEASAQSRIDAWAVKKKIRIDGLLREWPGGFVRLRHAIKGSASRADPKVSGLVGYDARHLYVALKVTDKKLVRTASMGRAEDHATLLLAFPKARGGWSQHELRLYAGETGKSAAAAKLGNRKVKGARVVEAPTDRGYVLEAKVPWSAFPPAKRIRAGLRAALRYTDADRPGSVHAIVGTSKASGGSMPAMPLEAEQGLDVNLIKAESLSSRPARRKVGNVSGNGMLEVVAVYGKFLTIVGSHFRKGEQFYFSDLGVADASAVRQLSLHDFTGDGKREIFLVLRAGSTDTYREIVRVVKVGRDDQPFIAFQHEVAVVTPDGSIRNEFRIKRRGKRAVLQISQGKSEGFEAGTYSEPKPSEMASTLYPWQTIKSRTFGWKGQGFEKIDEKLGAAKAPQPKLTSKKGAPSGPPAPPPPRPPTADELLDRVYALYRKDRGVGKKKPRFDFVTDVAGDARAERVLVHGLDVVVFGKGFRGGTSYAFSTLGVKDAKDIEDVTARDLTGDGKAEIIVYGVRHTKTSEELGGVVVDRHLLLVYKVGDSGIGRIFGAETGRVLGDDKIIGSVKFKPRRRGLSVELYPGRAVGWTKKTYPFPQDTQPAGGIEPLLTPWGGLSPRRYEWNGTKYELR